MLTLLCSPGTGERSWNSCNSLSRERISGHTNRSSPSSGQTLSVSGQTLSVSGQTLSGRDIGSPSHSASDDVPLPSSSLSVSLSSASCADQNAALTPLSDKYCAHDNLTKKCRTCDPNVNGHAYLCCRDNKSALLINTRFTFSPLISFTYFSCDDTYVNRIESGTAEYVSRSWWCPQEITPPPTIGSHLPDLHSERGADFERQQSGLRHHYDVINKSNYITGYWGGKTAAIPSLNDPP